jgi:hypothetical protein
LIADVYRLHDDTLRRPRGPTREHHVEPAGHPESASARRPDDRLARDSGHECRQIGGIERGPQAHDVHLREIVEFVHDDHQFIASSPNLIATID